MRLLQLQLELLQLCQSFLECGDGLLVALTALLRADEGAVRDGVGRKGAERLEHLDGRVWRDAAGRRCLVRLRAGATGGLGEGRTGQDCGREKQGGKSHVELP